MIKFLGNKIEVLIELKYDLLLSMKDFNSKLLQVEKIIMEIMKVVEDILLLNLWL